jgi:PadR family transcriptional regulator PadR
MTIDKSLLAGSTALLIMKLLEQQDMYGYQMIAELRRQSERTSRDYEERVRLLTDQLRLRQTEEARLAARMKDVTQLQQEAQQLREQLQVREKDLTAERQKCEELRQQQAISQQAMLSKLAELETPSFGTAQTLATNQSREAKMVKLPRWMRIGR